MQQLTQIDILLWRSLAIFLLVGTLMGFAVSLLLIFKPHHLTSVSRVANRWISMRHIEQWLNRSISIEQWFYRYHRPLGILLSLAAGYILLFFGLLFDRTAALHTLGGYVPNMLLPELLDALVLASLIGAVVVLFVGLSLWLRPKQLRGIDTVTNQWVSSSRVSDVLDVQHSQVERYATSHARPVGWLLLLSNIYVFFILFRLLV